MSVPPDLYGAALAICGAKGWDLQGEVGAGAFKTTFHAKVTASESLALKVLRPGLGPQRTAREIEAMGRCSHKGIARLLSLETHPFGGQIYTFCTEEFLAGGSLQDRLDAGGAWPPDQLHELGACLIEAVGHIAELDLVHRDLKPDNIMFRDAGAVAVITDFGLVRDLAASSLTQTWQQMGPGTPIYAPAEQLNNDKSLIDWRSDQFSLAVTLAVVGYGAHPFDANMTAAVQQVAQRGHLDPSFVAWAHASGLRVLTKMLGGWPIQRYRTAKELAEAWAAQRGTP